jgi:hypothetical protein
MTFDLLSTVGITAGATVVVATFVALFGSSLTQRISIGVMEMGTICDSEPD